MEMEAEAVDGRLKEVEAKEKLERCCITAGYAVIYVHKAKWTKLGAACERAGMVFLTLAVDTFGAIHAEGVQFLKKLGKSIAQSTCQEDSLCVNQIFQRVSILLVKGNISLLLNRRPETDNLID